MHAYWPHSWPHAALAAALLPAILLAGLALSLGRARGAARLGAWSLVLSSFLAVERLCRDEPAGLRMLLICGAVLYAMKSVVAVETRIADGLRLSPGAWLRWAALWPGMDPSLFAAPFGAPLPGWRRLVVEGANRGLFGLLLILAARLAWEASGSRLAATALLLPGLSLVLHFGLFNVLAGLWRRVGVPAERLFDAPLLATSLSEFWGRRWNLPFTQMVQRAVYRPLSPVGGRSAAALAGFALSGLLHELAISVPVGRGFGLPLLYFALHGLLVLLERGWRSRRWWAERPAWAGRVWTCASLVLPMPVLFHRPFLEGVVWPLIGLGG